MVSRDLEQERTAIAATIGDMTLVDVLNRNATRLGTRPAISWSDGDGSHTISWATYRDNVEQAAAGLTTLGIEPGAFVAVMATNRPEHVTADLAAVFAGGVPVSMYNTLAPEQIQYIAGHCAAKVAVVEDHEFLDRWASVWDDLPDLSHIVLIDGESDDERVVTWSELVMRGTQLLADDPNAVDRRSAAVRPDDLATLIYTSGTTGTPKGVMISHRNVLWTTECTSRTVPGVAEHPRLVSYLPLAHIGERLASHYSGLWRAGSVTYVADLADVAEAVQATKPQVFFAVPRVWEKFQAGLMARLESEPNERRRALALSAVELATDVMRRKVAGEPVSLKEKAQVGIYDKLVFSKIRSGLGLDELSIAVSAAAPIAPELLVFFRGLGIPIYELYGMTESSGPGITNKPGADRIGSVGRPMPGVELMTADDDEILMRGGLVTQGYYKNPEATAETYDEDGWLHTGDLGRIDEAGYLTIIGRKKEIIINAAGKNIAPAKLENLVKQHPLIAQACVVGDGRRYITLVIALDPEVAEPWAAKAGVAYENLGQFSREPAVVEAVTAIVEEANEHVARVEQAKKWYVAGDEWSPETGELTPSLKLKRRVVLERYGNEIETMYAD